MGNAHAWRHRHGLGKPCPVGCIYCTMRPKGGAPGKRRKNYTNKISRGRHTPKGKRANRRQR